MAIIAAFSMVGLLSRAQETLQTVTDRGNTTTNSLQIGGGSVNANTTKLLLNNPSGKNFALSSGANMISEQGFHIYNWTDNQNSPLLSLSNNGYLGIGTASPTSNLEVVGSANYTWATTIINNGTTNAHGLYVNINSASDGVPFRVDKGGSSLFEIADNGILSVRGVASFRSIVPTDGYLTINSGGSTTQGYINWWKPGNTRVAYMGYNDGSSYNNLGLTLEGANFIVNGGDVGIGTTDPKGYKLAVNGSVRAKEIKVENANWPDYVFAKSYPLRSLLETEKHIKEKGHLPGIPSAAEVKANGIDLGEMNAKLLQKIEELTLHMIELTKQNKLQNEKYDREIKYLKSKLK